MSVDSSDGSDGWEELFGLPDQFTGIADAEDDNDDADHPDVPICDCCDGEAPGEIALSPNEQLLAESVAVVVTSVAQLVAVHELLWTKSISSHGRILPAHVLREIRQEGESRLGVVAAAELLEAHPGIAAWEDHLQATAEDAAVGNIAEAVRCSSAAQRIGSALRAAARARSAAEGDHHASVTACGSNVARAARGDEALRMRRKDWDALLELTLTPWPSATGRVDFSAWPPFVEEHVLPRLAEPESRVPPLAVICARLIAREPVAYGLINYSENNASGAAELEAHGAAQRNHRLARRLGGGGVFFDPSAVNVQDPLVPYCRSGTDWAGAGVRRAQHCANWPFRIVRIAGRPYKVLQRAYAKNCCILFGSIGSVGSSAGAPTGALGTGAAVWGGALALVEELDRRGSAWMSGRRVVELGAGNGLVSLAAVLLGARHVVSTDLAGENFEVSAASAAKTDRADGEFIGAHRLSSEATAEEARHETLLDLIAMNRELNSRNIEMVSCGGQGMQLPDGKQKPDCATTSSATRVPRWDIAPLRWGDDDQALRVLALFDEESTSTIATRCSSAGSDIGGGNTADLLVLCAECAYDELFFDDLIATLQLLSSGGKTEIIMGHFPRAQAGSPEPEIRAFERKAREAGFAVERIVMKAASTGVNYEIHSLKLEA